MLISLIVPCYNEQEALPIFYEESTKVLAGMNCEYEFLFVNDGSKDATLSILKGLAEKDKHVTYLSFSRNFGKEAAMYAGFTNARGDYVAVMDADMQDPPALLPQMFAMLASGEFDSVATRRVNREGEPPIRSWFARQFYRIINRISDADIVDGARDFRLMKREMVDAIVEMGEYNRFSKGLFSWVGFRTKWLSYHNVERAAGETKWSFGKLLRYSLDGILGFSTLPLSLSSYGGIFFCGAAFLTILFLVVRYLIWHDPVQGWTTLMCAMLLISGVQLLCVGILGQYLARIYLEVKNRPVYLLKETDEEETENEG